jgi:F-type H+-transporting ATPase subunit b
MASRIVVAAVALLAAWLPALLPGAEAEAGHGHGGEQGVIPPTVWGVLIFVTVLLILWKKAFPPITKALEERARLIRESLEAAVRAKAEAEALIQKHEASLEKARAEARAIIEEGKADAERVKDGIVQSAKRESEELTARARREIELAKQSAVDELDRRAVQLSVEIAAKLIKKTLKPEDHQELIRESIRKYQEVK